MEKNRTVYDTIEVILERIDSSGDFVLQDLSPMEEKAVALLIQYRAVIRATRMDPISIFAGENFSEMVELGPEKYITLAEKLSPTMVPGAWKVLNSNLLFSGAVGATIGGLIAGAIAWLFGCG